MDKPSFDRRETNHLLFTVFAASLVLFMYKWRTTDFTYSTGIPYFIFLFLIFIVLMFGAMFFQKRWAFHKGYDVRFDVNLIYMLIGVLITFLFQGFILVLAPGFIILKDIRGRRMGNFGTYVHERDIAAVAIIGMSVFFACFVFFGILYATTQNFLFKEVMRTALLLALFMLVPTPKNYGLSLFKWSPWFVVFFFFCVFYTFEDFIKIFY